MERDAPTNAVRCISVRRVSVLNQDFAGLLNTVTVRPGVLAANRDLARQTI